MKLLLLALSFLPFATSSATPAEPTSAAEATVVATETRTGVLPGFSRTEWTLTLPSGENTHIVVDGDGDSDLDAFLYDENGNLVAFDNDATDYCILDVLPRWTGSFTLRIENVGARANLYELRVD